MVDIKQNLYSISVKRKEYFAQLARREGLRQMEIDILLFLHEHPNSNTLTEIIHSNDYTKSHVSTSISSLVDRGYIAKNVSATNRKVQNLTLLPKSKPIVEEILSCLDEFHKKSLDGVTDDEILMLTQILAKINENLKDVK